MTTGRDRRIIEPPYQEKAGDTHEPEGLDGVPCLCGGAAVFVSGAAYGLLHDLYLYDPRTLPSYRQCFAHPVAAAENAAALCGGLTAREKNCILAHMWPLSRRAPRSREAAAVCLADKLCATAEIMQIWRNLGLRRAVLSGA